MNNPFRIFTSPLFGNVRAAYIDGVAWFAGKDVATALGYRDTKYAVKMHVAKEDRKQWRIPTPSSGLQEAIIINESGLYSLVLSSKLPAAQQFKHWVTAEVLPSIRKTGSYSLVEPPAQNVVTAPDNDSILLRVEKLIAIADRLEPSQERTNILLHAACLISGQKIF